MNTLFPVLFCVYKYMPSYYNILLPIIMVNCHGLAKPSKSFFILLFCIVFTLFYKMPQSDNITIAMVNYQELATLSKRKNVINYYKQYSIICLEDTNLNSDHEPFIGSQWGYKCCFYSYIRFKGCMYSFYQQF